MTPDVPFVNFNLEYLQHINGLYWVLFVAAHMAYLLRKSITDYSKELAGPGETNDPSIGAFMKNAWLYLSKARVMIMNLFSLILGFISVILVSLPDGDLDPLRAATIVGLTLGGNSMVLGMIEARANIKQFKEQQNNGN